MFLNPWYANLGPSGGEPAVPSASPSTSETDSPRSERRAALGSPRLERRPPAAPPSPRPGLRLRPGWTVHTADDGRIFYCNHVKRTSSWLPPLESWRPGDSGLPYGWEMAVDHEGKTYFINHLNRTTTYEDPRQEEEPPPEPRQVTLHRHPELGFGFVAGSEKPVIVRFVTDGGPSVDKLQPGDQIWQINGEDVKMSPRDQVIQRVRSCQQQVTLVVCQPPLDNTARKSALLSAAKKLRLKSNPSRVRFAEGVVVNGQSNLSPFSSDESCIPFMPNVLKVFLENGQTKSFKYDSSTTVEDVLESLQAKLGISCVEHFSIVAEHVNSVRRSRLTLLDNKETLARIAARPGARHLRCLFRVTFVPRDAYELLRKDPVAFEYLYVQCCTDVVQERFAPELKYDVALQLAALHVHQHALSNNLQGKITVKNIEREFGLERFLPISLVESMKRKELRKLLAHFLKQNQSLVAAGQKQLTALQAKLHYLNIISHLPSYGAKCFNTSIGESNLETVILVSPKFGISQINSLKSSSPEALCEVSELAELEVTREHELSHRVHLVLKDPDKQASRAEGRSIVLNLDERDASELVLAIGGYYLLATGRTLPVRQDASVQQDDAAPPYHTTHVVTPDSWSYTGGAGVASTMRADFSLPPPYRASAESTAAAGMTNGHPPAADRSPRPAADRSAGAAPTELPNGPAAEGSPRLNGHAPAERRDGAGSSPEEQRRAPAVDKNMNKTTETNANLARFTAINGKPDFIPAATDRDEEEEESFAEAKNSEVIERLAGMRQLVADAENYLTTSSSRVPDEDVEDAESLRSALSRSESEAAFGPLKHSDSLLLISQTSKDRLDGVKGIKLPDVDHSESDTDSLSTPTGSPYRRPLQAASQKPAAGGASFGLLSPDNASEDQLKEVLQSTDGASEAGLQTGAIYADPDIIDLTMIPPPMTPDEDGPPRIPPELSTPPTPFADRETLEAELQALERDLGDLDRVGEMVRAAALHSPEDSPSSGFSSQPTGSDIDSLIANLTLPPPPSDSQQAAPRVRQDGSPVVELTRDQIASFIIPPPPAGVAGQTSQSEEGHYDANPVAGSEELRVTNGPPPPRRPPVAGRPRVGAKIASLQHQLRAAQANGTSQVTEAFASDQKLERALEENARVFRTLERRREKPGGAGGPPQPPPRPVLRHGPGSQLPPLPPKPPVVTRSGQQEVDRADGGRVPSGAAVPRAAADRYPPPRSGLSAGRPRRRRPTVPRAAENRRQPPPPDRSPRRLPLPPPPRPAAAEPPPPPPEPPLETSSPRLPPRGRPADSSFEEDSLETSVEGDEEDRTVFFQACDRLGVMSHRLDEIASACALAHQAGGPEGMNEAKFQLARDELTNEARQFVTASKLFVKGATESADRLVDCLHACMGLMERATAVTQLAASPHHGAAPDPEPRC
ncbi:FERM and PDZ domain-containing protein 4 [Amphibalanus amphitrite]|uniref:FERM and PDZ domain-containing protein 4 n=1 Tax=Amphibalanus amphitrite TaxID=1232801 RepID=A0A6A4WV86_AMPAM|nr:FERM and PDZ domain-containing protein 4 [Amphibalanus amphitrite]